MKTTIFSKMTAWPAVSRFGAAAAAFLRAWRQTRPVRTPGLQRATMSAVFCRPHALTRPSDGVFKLALTLSVGLVLAGCSTTPPDTRVRFHGTDQASVVLQYNSQDYIFMTKPSYREQGYLRQIRRPDVAGAMEEMQVPRDLAVVSLAWQLEGERLQAVLSDWKSVLKQCGFRRVVFVRGWGSTSVEGAIIVEASDLKSESAMSTGTQPAQAQLSLSEFGTAGP